MDSNHIDKIGPWFSVSDLQAEGILFVEDGNHGQYRPRPDEFTDSGPALFIRAGDVNDGRVLFDTAKSINYTALRRIRKGVGESGDVLFTHKGTVGRVAMVPEQCPNFVCSPQTTFWRTMDLNVLDRQFLHAFMRSPLFVNQWIQRKGETDMADYVSLTAQRALSVPLPEIRWQRKIGSIIGSFDDFIVNNTRRIEILEESAKALYREWFVHYRYPGHENDTMVDSELGPIPKGWKIFSINDLLVKPTRSTKVNTKDYRPFGSLPVVDQGDGLIAGYTDNLTYMFTGDLPVVIFGDHTCRFKFVDFPFARGADGTQVLVPKENISSSYFFEMLSSLNFEHFGYQRHFKHLKQKRVVIGPDELQFKFEMKISSLRNCITPLREQSLLAGRIRDLLLPRLVSGELDASDLDWVG